TEVSGKDEQIEVFDDGYEPEWGALTRRRSRRSRLFRIAASRPAELRAATWLENDGGLPASGIDITRDRQELVGEDISGSQIQIFAVLLGLRKLERRLRTTPYKELAAQRAWDRDRDPTDPFKLPDGHDYEGASDPRLKEATKKATMTWLYGSPPAEIVEQIEDDPEQFGRGLGTPANLSLFLRDEKLELTSVEEQWRPACRRITKRVNLYAGVIFTDPFDGARVRWNPVEWTLTRVAGSDAVRLYAKAPISKQKAGDFPVFTHKLTKMFGPCFIHTLDSAFCGLVVEELERYGVEVV